MDGGSATKLPGKAGIRSCNSLCAAMAVRVSAKPGGTLTSCNRRGQVSCAASAGLPAAACSTSVSEPRAQYSEVQQGK